MVCIVYGSQEPMRRIVREQLRQLSPSHRVMLYDNLLHFEDLFGLQVAFGTGCSGADVFVHCAELVTSVLSEEFGLSLSARHSFSAESVPFKRAFIATHWKPEALLVDVAELSKERGFDCVRGTEVAIPDAVIVAIGFECDSVSPLNSAAKDHRSCISEKRGKTGVHRTANDVRACGLCCLS